MKMKLVPNEDFLIAVIESKFSGFECLNFVMARNIYRKSFSTPMGIFFSKCIEKEPGYRIETPENRFDEIYEDEYTKVVVSTHLNTTIEIESSRPDLLPEELKIVVNSIRNLKPAIEQYRDLLVEFNKKSKSSEMFSYTEES